MRQLKQKPRKPANKAARSRQKPSLKSQPVFKRLTNFIAAQTRAARHRISYVIKFAAACCAGIIGFTFLVLLVFGQLDDAGAILVERIENRFVASGYKVQWLDLAGSTRLTAQQIAVLIGAEPGTAINKVDLNAAKSILEAQPGIKQASVIRLWPDRIAVVIEEREPFALWQVDQVHHVIDNEGVVITGIPPQDYADLPRVVGAGANEHAGRFLLLLAMHKELNAHTTHALRIGERRWSLRLKNGGEVLLPQTDEASALAILTSLHKERGILDYDAQLFDMRTSGEIVMRPWPDRVSEQAGRGA